MGEALMVGMAEVKVIRSSADTLIALGLGSCIGVCAYDPQARVAGLAHIVLPDSAGHEGNPGKFADTAIPLLLQEMQQQGAAQKHIRVALTGGAQLFAFSGSGPRLEIGARNAAAVKSALEKWNIPIVASDVGGSTGRTVYLSSSGEVRVKTIGRGERDLVALGGSAPGGRIVEASAPPAAAVAPAGVAPAHRF